MYIGNPTKETIERMRQEEREQLKKQDWEIIKHLKKMGIEPTIEEIEKRRILRF